MARRVDFIFMSQISSGNLNIIYPDVISTVL